MKNVKLGLLIVFAAVLFLTMQAPVKANVFTAMSHKSSYYGTSTRYDTLADAQAGSNPVDTFNTGDVRVDFGIEIDSSAAGYTYVTSTWFYTTDPDHGANSGWGNTVANSRTGFLQIYDADNSTINSMQGHFGDFDGSKYTTFTTNISGGFLDPYSAWGTPTNWSEAASFGRGNFLSWSLALTYGGLEGILSGSKIVSNNHPTSINGVFSGLFVDLNGDYHTILIDDFNTNAWSYDVREQLNGDFMMSSFSETIPEPATLALLGLGGLLCRRFKKA